MIYGDLITARIHLFRALADRTRIEILELLRARGEMSVTAICEAIGKEQNLTSHHLSCLRNCGLAQTRRDGKNIYYSLRNEKVTELFSKTDAHVREVLESVLSCEVVSRPGAKIVRFARGEGKISRKAGPSRKRRV